MTKRGKIITISLCTITFIVISGFVLTFINNNEYESQASLGLGIGILLHFITILFLTIYNFIIRDKYIGYSYLICVGIEILGFIIAFIIFLNALGKAIGGSMKG